MNFNFDISLSGLFASQRGLQVAQNNIANADSPGYAREQLNLKANASGLPGNKGNEVGSGVFIEEITRIKDDLLIQQARTEKGRLGDSQEMQQTLSNLEIMFGEGSEGSLSKLLTDFYNSWEEASKFPEQNSYRVALLGASEQLANKFNVLSDKMEDLKTEVSDNLEMNISKVNDLVKKIAEVNNKITLSGTKNPNALLDERDNYLDQLAQYGDIKVETNHKQPLLVDVSIGGSRIVSGTSAKELKGMLDAPNQEWVLAIDNEEVKLTSGKIHANVNLFNKTINGYEDQLDQLVGSIITEVNAEHVNGFGLDNSTGNLFFVGSGAGNIGVSNAIKADTNKIALSGQQDALLNVDVGNSDVAKKIVNIQKKNLASLGNLTQMNFYQNVSVQMANDLSVVKNNAMVQETALTSLEQERQSVQGVNIDEEMTNLMKYQRSYSANAKAVQSVNQLFDSLFQIF